MFEGIDRLQSLYSHHCQHHHPHKKPTLWIMGRSFSIDETELMFKEIVNSKMSKFTVEFCRKGEGTTQQDRKDVRSHEVSYDSVICEPILEIQGIYSKTGSVRRNNTLARDEKRRTSFELWQLY